MSAFRSVGGYDESFSHNEDAELDARLKGAGYAIWLMAEAPITYSPRAAALPLLRQYLSYGRGRAMTAVKHRLRLKPRQLLPLDVLPAVALLPLALWKPVAAMPALIWAMSCLAYGAWLGVRDRDLCAGASGLAAMIMHFGWSAGFFSETWREARRRLSRILRFGLQKSPHPSPLPRKPALASLPLLSSRVRQRMRSGKGVRSRTLQRRSPSQGERAGARGWSVGAARKLRSAIIMPGKAYKRLCTAAIAASVAAIASIAMLLAPSRSTIRGDAVAPETPTQALASEPILQGEPVNRTTAIFGSGGNSFVGKDGRIFVIRKGGPGGLITGFDAGNFDRLRIEGYGFTEPSQVRELMLQDGSNVVIKLPDGKEVRFQNMTAGRIAGDCLQLELDRSRLKETFSDDFDTLSWDNQGLMPGPPVKGKWRTNYGGVKPASEASHSLGGEEQVYSDLAFHGTAEKPFGINPFQVKDGVLRIEGNLAPAEILPYIWGRKYTSGLITSKGSFSQLYGVFEIRAKMPKGKGYFPAFRLLAVDGSWPPEAGIFEMPGHQTDTLYTTWHSNTGQRHTSVTIKTPAPDLSADFHQIALDWQKEELRWYFDGVEVAREKTPPDMNKPMYILANLAIGANWPGSPDETTVFPGYYEIDWIKAYRWKRAGEW